MLQHYSTSILIIPTTSALLLIAQPLTVLSFSLIILSSSSSLNLQTSNLLPESNPAAGSRLVFPYGNSASQYSEKLIVNLGEHGRWDQPQRRNLASQAASNFAAQVPHLLAAKPTNSSLILAASRTRRKDPLNHFKLYTGGWNITNRHYFASVGYTAAPFFTVSLIWFIVFGIALLWICVRYFYLRKEFQAFPSKVYTAALALLGFCTLSAIAGSILLYLGQGKFHHSTVETLDYVAGQANITVVSLRSVSGYLLAAREIDVISAVLPPEVQKSIENVVESKLKTSSNRLESQTMKNAHRIKSVLASIGLSIAIIAAFMLVVTLLGLLSSVLGSFQRPPVIYSLVIVGWLLISGTLICSGIYHFLHNAIADTCVAMEEWVHNPAAHTALDDIIPCVDKAAAQETLLRSKEATYQIVNEMNGVITNISNKDIPPSVGPPAYFNQSGPLVPVFCNPFNSDFSNRSCAYGEVDYNDANKVWKDYTCDVSPNGLCRTSGRLTPKFYTQLAAAVNVSYGLYHYGPFLVSLQDCSFIYQTFSNISANHCPGLRKYTQWVYSGSVLLAVSVMFLVICWPVLTHRGKRQEDSMSL